MSKRTRVNGIIILLITLIGIYFYFNVNYYDRYLIKNAKQVEAKHSPD
ncbi:MAG: hypothetical protein V2J62_12375 [candidate division KSB1 bacterium]|jgi:hypothetical protein|nr:hypothetical protein [candidate division KSB1 bacterium]